MDINDVKKYVYGEPEKTEFDYLKEKYDWLTNKDKEILQAISDSWCRDYDIRLKKKIPTDAFQIPEGIRAVCKNEFDYDGIKLKRDKTFVVIDIQTYIIQVWRTWDDDESYDYDILHLKDSDYEQYKHCI